MKTIILLTAACLVLASCAPASSISGVVGSGSTNSTMETPQQLVATTQTTQLPTATVTPTPTNSSRQGNAANSLPNFDHIILMVLENEDYQNVIGNSSMPHLKALAQQNVLLSNYFAVSHPSLPNYITLVSGSTQGITSDCTNCFVNQPNLGDEINASGRSWKAYMESMPSPCFIGDANPYAQKHNPFIYFDSIRLNKTLCDNSIVPLTQLDGDLTANKLPNFSFIMANLCNSGHNCSPATADNWVFNMVTKLQASPALGRNSLIFITFDEGSTSDTASCCGMGKGGGQVATVLISPIARPGFTDDTAYSHYSLLKTILTAWNLPDLGQTRLASVVPITAPWNQQQSQTVPATPTPVPVTLSKSGDAQQAGCSSSSPASGAYTVKVCFSSPTDGSTLTGNATVTTTVKVTGSSTNAKSLVFYLNGTYLLTAFYSPYSFILPSEKWIDGKYSLSVEAVMRDNSITQRASISVVLNNGVNSQVVNNNQFAPSTGNPQANGQPFIVAAGGDGAGGGADASKVVDLIASSNPNLFLYLGDVYENGSVAEFYNWYGTQGTNFSQFRSITDPTVGNHEYLTQGAAGYFDYWNNISPYYSFNAGGWHFISLDSNTSYQPADPKSAQYQWLQKDLAANSQTCTIAYYHQPLFNIGAEGPTQSMADVWKLMAQYGVTIVLNGHDHDYQRWVPLDGDGQPSPTGITEFVVGSAGHGLQTISKTDNRVAYSNDSKPAAFGILLLQLNHSGVNFTYKSIDGSVLDSGVIPCNSKTKADAIGIPTKPSGLSASVMNGNQVGLSWTAASDNTGVAGYMIYRNGTAIATVPASNLTYTDSNVVPATTYDYSLVAFNQAGNHSPTSNVVAATIPGTPTSQTFLPQADTYVNSSSPGSNYGKVPVLRVETAPDMNGYLRFTVSGLGGRSITHARLLIYINNSNKQGISVCSVANNNWNELYTNNNNAPTLGSILASSGALKAGSWITLDVTAYISGEGTYSFGITTPSSKVVSLASRESGVNAPQLIIDFQ